MTPAERLDALGQRLALLTKEAPALRAAGIEALEITDDKISVRLAAPYGPVDVAPMTATTEQPVTPEPDPEPDALSDPATFGGDVPGFEMDEES